MRENAFNLVTLHIMRLWRIEFHPLNLAYRVDVKQLMLMCPGEEVDDSGLLACSSGRTQMQVHPKEVPQYLCGYYLHWFSIKRRQLGYISRIGGADVRRAIRMGKIGEECSYELTQWLPPIVVCSIRFSRFLRSDNEKTWLHEMVDRCA